MFPDEEDGEPIDEERMTALASALDDGLRKIGLFTTGGIMATRHPSRREPMLALTARIGAIALSERIQKPAEFEIRSSLREVERDIKKSDFEEAREAILRDGFFNEEEGDDE